MPEPIPLGSELEVGGNTMLPNEYAVHSVMLLNDEHVAEPMILVDLDGLTATGRASVRLLVPEALAAAIRDGVNVSLAQLEQLRRGPH